MNCFLVLKSIMQYQPLWLEFSPWEAVSTLTRGSTKPRTAALTPRSPLCPRENFPLQSHHWRQHLHTTMPGQNSPLGQIGNDLGKCGSHLGPFAARKLWLERSRIKHKKKAEVLVKWKQVQMSLRNENCTGLTHKCVILHLGQQCDLGQVSGISETEISHM